MPLVEMSREMRDLVDNIPMHRVGFQEDRFQEYLDQASNSYLDWAGEPGFLFASYTPWGIARIEVAFLDRMFCPAKWDSKDLIRKEILSNPHLSTSLKESLLKVYEQADWTRWYDTFYAMQILGGCLSDALQAEIQNNPHLTEASRSNLLENLRTFLEPQHA